MKISKKLLVGYLMIAVVALGGISLLTVAAQSTEMTNQQIELIRTNCLSAKTTLHQLHASDALLRVNRGQLYESISTKLMNKFNSRVANNSFNSTDLNSITKNYGLMLDTFRSDYIAYEEQLSIALGIDCSKQPVAFYDAMSSARTKRVQVHTDVVNLNQSIAQYQLTVDQFEKDYQTSIEGAKN
ncbi:MAG TPA: hypothetical protein VFD55_02305 [Candidatus Angelobacter sp.]|nr:hypothetical protein [Candidatus Angelobacter sp.]